MIVEALICGVTVCFCASLVFARFAMKHHAQVEGKRPKGFHREVLERELEEWHGKLQIPTVQERIKELEQKLLELDDE
jgi:hypothetical protein